MSNAEAFLTELREELYEKGESTSETEYRILVALTDKMWQLAGGRATAYLAATNNLPDGSIDTIEYEDDQIRIVFVERRHCSCCSDEYATRHVPAAILWDDSLIEKAEGAYRAEQRRKREEEEARRVKREEEARRATEARERAELERLKAKYGAGS